MTRQMANALRGLGDQVRTSAEAIRQLHQDYGNKASGILANVFGVTPRTGQRWISWAEGKSSQKSDPLRRDPARAQALIDLMRNRRAAKRLRKARRIKVGKVRVIDKSPRKGKRGQLDPRPRAIGTRDKIGILATAAEAAADLIESGDYDRAAEILEVGLLEAYGVPEGALEIDSYLGTPEIEE